MPAHFSPAALDYLADLARHNERDWFEKHRETYEREVKEPMLAIIDELNGRLEQFAPEYVFPPQKAMMRIHRDVRFSHDKSPYKTNLAAAWPRAGQSKFGGASFYLQVSPAGVMVGGGCHEPPAPQLRAIRDRVLAHHRELRAILAAPGPAVLFDPVDGHPLTRPPRGYPADHPAVDLLSYRDWVLVSHLPAAAATGNGFVEAVAERFRAATPFVEWLNVGLRQVAG